jgi:O-succinylbenzoic acid--CoA ligase
MEFIPDFFVGGIADAVFGEKLVLVMKGKSNYWMSIYSSLDKYQKKEVFYIDKFIETENGKIKRKEMLESI